MPEEETTPLNPGETPETTDVPDGDPDEAITSAVGRKEFDKFQGEVTSALALIAENLANLSKVQDLKPPVVAPVAKVEVEGGPDKEQATPVPPAWQKAVHEILGIDFECEFVQPDNGGNIFKIIVPKEKSNASQAHWKEHGSDRRSKELGNAGLEGVKAYAKKVRLNLLAAGKKLVQYP